MFVICSGTEGEFTVLYNVSLSVIKLRLIDLCYQYGTGSNAMIRFAVVHTALIVQFKDKFRLQL